jgi:hypothetical protein
MESLKRKWSLVFLLSVICNCLHAQTEEEGVNSTEEEKAASAYVGVGVGFDYGGVGGKVEYLPVKNLGVFFAAGYNLLSVGWNLGLTYKFIPDKKVSPNLMLMYGYNAVFKGSDSYSQKYDKTSLGLTVGINLDIRTGSHGNKWSVGLFLPFRSGKFMDNYDAIKNDSNMELTNELIPIGISCGYNFRI